MKVLKRYWFVIAVIIVLATAVTIGTINAKRFLDAEKEVYSMRVAVPLVESFLLRNEGRWPNSWADLQKIEFKEFGEDHIVDWVSIKKYVTIDFATDAEKALQGYDRGMPPIYVKDSVYDYSADPFVEHLIETLRSFVQKPRKT